MSAQRFSQMLGVSSENASATEKKLLKSAQEYRKLAQKVHRRPLQCRRRNANLPRLCNRRFIDQVDDLAMSAGTRLILKGELRNFKRKPKGRSWTLQEKLFWLPHYKRSPRAFRLLSAYLCIPGESALKELLSKITIEPGIIEASLKLLKQTIPTLPDKDKVCTVLFDEVYLRGHLRQRLKHKKIEGFEDYGLHGRSHLVADHALVFMVQGLGFQFVLPIAYYFVSKTCPATMLKILLKDVINVLLSIGLTVVASVSDQGPTNRRAINELKQKGGDDVFYYVGDKRVAHVWDVPYLIKNVRNNLLTSDLQYDEGRIGRWRDIIEYSKLDNSLCKMSKLTLKHLNPQGRDKMRVPLAVQTLSNTRANFMQMLHDVTNGEKLPNCMDTVHLIRDIDTFTNLTIGPRSKKDEKDGKRTDVTGNSIHHSKWNEMTAKLMKWVFIRKKDGSRHVPHCVRGLIENIKTFRYLWVKVKKLGLNRLHLRGLNQDALENLFCLIRQCCGCSTDLTCGQFTAALKTTMISKFAKTVKGKNCMDDSAVFLRDLALFLKKKQCRETSC